MFDDEIFGKVANRKVAKWKLHGTDFYESTWFEKAPEGLEMDGWHWKFSTFSFFAVVKIWNHHPNETLAIDGWPSGSMLQRIDSLTSFLVVYMVLVKSKKLFVSPMSPRHFPNIIT